MNDRVIGWLTTAPVPFTLARTGGEAKATGDDRIQRDVARDESLIHASIGEQIVGPS